METNIDAASQIEQLQRDVAIKKVQDSEATRVKLEPKGRCHNPICDDDLENPLGLFCPGGVCPKEYDRYILNNGDPKRNLRV